MKKIKELEKNVANMRKELTELAQIDNRIMEIVKELDAFRFTQTKRGIDIWYGRGVIPMMGIFKENDMCYALELMNFLIRIYYKCNKVISILNSRDAKVVINVNFQIFARGIRKQSLEYMEQNKKFQSQKFYEEFKEFVEVAKKALHHKVDEIGTLTARHVREESKELTEIRKIYKQIRFREDSIRYYDYIERDKGIAKIDNAVEMQYMIMVTYMKAYSETVLWLRKKDPSGNWCPFTAWQVLERLKKIIYKYFFLIN